MHTRVEAHPALNVRAVQRQVAALLPEARPATGGESTFEVADHGMDAPRLISATLLEPGAMGGHRVQGAPSDGFSAFLDGTQRSEVANHLGAVPIMLGRAAAVIRARRDRRMHTWEAPLVETRVYCPRAMIAAGAWTTLSNAFGALLVDSGEGTAAAALHPFALRDAAVHLVQAHREELEQRLAEQWCARERAPLFIDGGISGSESVAVSACTVGVVKSHRTLYAEGDALAAVLALRLGERSSVFRITSPKRTTVASWYLRLRDARGRDPMWGLVRVEVAHPPAGAPAEMSPRANEVSRWVLAEASPLALPDARWDKMVYGIRDCEEFLRAIQ